MTGKRVPTDVPSDVPTLDLAAEINRQFNHLELRIHELEVRLDALGAELASLVRVSASEQLVAELRERIRALEQRRGE